MTELPDWSGWNDDGHTETVGDFTLQRHADGVAYKLAWTAAHLPGVYADRDAAVLGCGFLLGGEYDTDLEAIRDRINGTQGRPITVDDLCKIRVGEED